MRGDSSWRVRSAGGMVVALLGGIGRQQGAQHGRATSGVRGRQVGRQVEAASGARKRQAQAANGVQSQLRALRVLRRQPGQCMAGSGRDRPPECMAGSGRVRPPDSRPMQFLRPPGPVGPRRLGAQLQRAGSIPSRAACLAMGGGRAMTAAGVETRSALGGRAFQMASAAPAASWSGAGWV